MATNMATNMDNMEKNIKKKFDNISWKVIESYFKDKYLTRLVRHQLESYNWFIEKQLFDTVQMFNPVKIHSEKEKEETGHYCIEIVINFSNLKILRPQIHENNGATKTMFPHEARLRNFTYSSPITLDLNIKILRKSGKDFKKIETVFKNIPSIHVGKIPIMLKSNICILKQFSHYNAEITKECNHDPGGYFIISGSEKTILAQERAAENNVMCFNIKKNNNKWSWLAEIKSIPLDKCISPKQINITIATRNNGNGHSIDIQIPRIKQPIPIFILFRALGIISDKEISNYILLNIHDKELEQMLFSLKASMIIANEYTTQEECFNYIVTYVMYTPIKMTKEMGEMKKREFTKSVLENDLYPHCTTQVEKVYFLGYMINKLLRTSFGWRKPDDRDSYTNKRLDLAGTLINNLFRNYFNKLVKDMGKQIVREINNGSWQSTNDIKNIINQTNIYKIIKSTTIENGIKRALATGDFGIKNTNSAKVGVAQVLNRLTYISTLSHLRRINTPIDKSGKLIPPRKLHNTQWGFICPAETPEGQSVGVVKNISYLSHITIKSEIEPILNILKDKVIKLDENSKFENLFGKVKVFVNGSWIGIAKNPNNLFKKLKFYKYSGIFNIYTSIVFNYKNKEIFICNDAGRLCRPLFKVKNNKLLIDEKTEEYIDKNCDWDELCLNHVLDESIVEYVDSAEQNSALIAIKPSKLKSNKDVYYNYTHCEIHPSTIFGILASCIPFPEHNQSPRNTYQCAMGKQAMGTYTTNFQHRMDKTAYVQTYTMRPLVDTRIMNIIKLNQIPSGSMVIVAIMTYTGYNQEDSIIFNEGSIERGLFSATIYHTEKDEDKNIHGDEEIRCKADKARTKGVKFANYDKLNENGIIPENTKIENRDIIIGKVVPIKENRNDPTKLIKYKDFSKIYRTSESCFVDKNYINRNGDGYTFAKIRTRTYRIPSIGDKFSSRHGQKGTIGLIIPEKDMPFTAQGLKPDIIINPHCIPSRMTMAQLKETLLGKVLLDLGLFGDGTSFGEYPIKEICKNLEKLNYEKHGEEILYNGMTGEQLESNIFIGPVFYQRLKHMTADKVHSRNIGPMVVLTRQPQEGRSRDGGLRFGEMERDCMISHGAAGVVYDRTYSCSDKYEVYVCDLCGLIAIYNDEKHIYNCKTCDNFVSFSRVKIPYSCKLLFQELTTMNAVPRIITNNSFK
tara:strand:+ start:250 stop:3822 length:3573 start_codon:yes stop_codon:yes gene_type:complete